VLLLPLMKFWMPLKNCNPILKNIMESFYEQIFRTFKKN